jgi:2-polyprenyl-6-methoxyphenol hydroxylase-like FAD-dependent oxidoreductase
MSQKPLTILISGAGVAGASLALMLARQPGFQMQPIITLVERSPVPRTTGQAVDIRGSGVDVIRKIGLESDIKARHTSETGLAFLNSKGTIAATFPATGDAKSQSATSEYEILRGDLTALLLEKVAEAKEMGAEVNVVYGEYIESMVDAEHDTGVEVSFANGKLSNQKFDVVIGADGVASKTRSMIFGKDDLSVHVQPSGMYLSFFSIPRIPEDDSLWRWAQIPPGLAIHLRPHCNQKTMGVYMTICNRTASRNPELEQVTHADVASQKAYLRQRFKNVEWQNKRFLDGLESCDDFYMSHWCQVRTPHWTKGRCAIVGDTAFATMGIGTSLAMTGAYCISGELSKITSADQVPDALRAYENHLRPYVTKHQGSGPPGGFQFANPQTEWGTWLLHTIMKVVAFLRLPQLLMPLFGGDGRGGWRIPEYNW